MTPQPPNEPLPPAISVPTPYLHKKKSSLFKGLIYGVPGTGKTSFAAGSVEIGKTLFLNVEGGMLSATDKGEILVFDIFNTPTKSCVDQLEEYLWICASRDTKTYTWLEGLKTIVLDSGSELLNLHLESIAAKASKKNSSREATDLWLEDYGKATSRLTRLFRMMRDLPYNVVVTALQKEVYEGKEDNKILKDLRPAFTSKLGESVMGFFDHVWCAYTTQKPATDGKMPTLSYQILTSPAGYYVAKTRGVEFPKRIGQVISNPQFAAIYNLLQQSEAPK